MSKDYSDLGLLPNLTDENSIGAKREKWKGPMKWGAFQDVQTTRVVAGALSLEQLVVLSEPGTAVGTLNLATTLRAVTTLRYVSPHKFKMAFAVPYISFYQGTVVSAANEIWPDIGTNVTSGRYDVQGWFDYQGWDGTASRWVGLITDTNGTSTQAITLITRWQQVDYVFGQGQGA
jgi:hypothetical protein